jgi:outer membrane receptor for ferrienterochelin and colicins
LYLQDETAAAGAVALTAGLRWDHHARFGTEWSPRVYAVWRAAPQWTVKGGVGHGFKAPTLKQTTPGYREDEGPNTYVANPALRPEVNDSAEIGVAWESARLGASAMLFHNRVRDLIVPRLISGTPLRGEYVFENTDRAVMKGVESALAWRGGPWALHASYTYLDARDARGARLEKRPRHALGLRTDVGQGAWRAGIALEHQAGLALASTTAGQPPQPVPDLTLVGLWGTWAFTPGLTLRAGVDNATDVVLSRQSPLFTYSEAPRTWRLALQGRW